MDGKALIPFKFGLALTRPKISKHSKASSRREGVSKTL